MGVKTTYQIIKPHKWWHKPMEEEYHVDYMRAKNDDDTITRVTKITYCCEVYNCDFEAVETKTERE